MKDNTQIIYQIRVKQDIEYILNYPEKRNNTVDNVRVKTIILGFWLNIKVRSGRISEN